MRKVHENYLKNLFSLLMVGVLFYFLLPFVGIYILLPVSFGVLSFIDFRTNQRKPEYLFGLKESNDFFKDRRGAWLLLKLPVMLLGFLFDLIVWILHGVLVFFYFLSDVFILLRDLLYWIFYGLLWFLRLFIPPLVILYKCIIHYLIKWPWWIYQVAFRSAKLSFYRIFYRIALRGTFLSIFIVLLFYGTGILIDVIPLVFIGIAFAILPLTWSYTEIASLRKRENGIRSYRRVRKLFMNGMISVRAILFYLTAVVVLLVIQILLYMLGWLPKVGFSLLGVSLNLSSLINIIIVFISVILMFSKFLMPPYIVLDRRHENNLSSSLYFLGVIGRRFIRYLLAHIPAAVFGAFLMIFPVIIVVTAGWLSINIKNTVLDARLNMLTTKEASVNGPEQYELQSRAEEIRFFREYPFNLNSEFLTIKTRIEKNRWLVADIDSSLETIRRAERMFNQDVDSMQTLISELENRSDSVNLIRADIRKQNLQDKIETFNRWKLERQDRIFRETAKLESSRNLVKQLPLVFLFTVVWISLLGGIAGAVLIAYLGNLYYDLYMLREDNKPVYIRQLIMHYREKDSKQPLLGFTLLFLIIAAGLSWYWFF